MRLHFAAIALLATIASVSHASPQLGDVISSAVAGGASVGNDITSVGGGLASTIRDGGSSVFTQVTGGAGGVLTTIVSGGSSIVSTIATGGSSIVDDASQGAEGGVSNASNDLQNSSMQTSDANNGALNVRQFNYNGNGGFFSLIGMAVAGVAGAGAVFL